MRIVDPIPNLGEPHITAMVFDDSIEFVDHRSERSTRLGR